MDPRIAANTAARYPRPSRVGRKGRRYMTATVNSSAATRSHRTPNAIRGRGPGLRTRMSYSSSRSFRSPRDVAGIKRAGEGEILLRRDRLGPGGRVDPGGTQEVAPLLAA